MLQGQIPIAFVAASLVVLIMPGPGVLYVVARSMGQGFLAAFVSALGLSCGVLVHVMASTIGLSALLMTSATAYSVLKYVGAIYLIYLGIQTLRSARPVGNVPAIRHLPPFQLFRDGVIVSALNPKIAVFFLAFIPQFVDPALGSVSRQFAVLGLAYAALALVTDSAYGFFAIAASRWFRARLLSGPWPQLVSGSLLIGLGVKAAVTARHQ